MSVRTIPPDSWTSFFEAFTRQHHGWLVTIDNLPKAEPLDAVRANGKNVEIRAGSVNRRLPNASKVIVTSSDADETAIDYVEIAGANEHITIRFRAPINPELVDGVMP